jgi:indole-3-glycerol phosphate synthase
MNILDTIVAKKKLEVQERKRDKSTGWLEKQPLFNKKTSSFKDFLLRKDKTGIVAEFKRRSPSKGIINSRAHLGAVAAAYSKHGASAISVLTDEEFFGGSLNDLLEIAAYELPILRKDFIVDEYQLVESKASGAAVILLIAACLSKDSVQKFAGLAKDIGLDVLLEVHNEEELDHICSGVDVLGVNNRDLKTFNVDINTSLQLIKKIPAEMVTISESGIDDIDAIHLLKESGFKGFLVGERFMKEKDPGHAFQLFAGQLKRAQ